MASFFFALSTLSLKGLLAEASRCNEYKIFQDLLKFAIYLLGNEEKNTDVGSTCQSTIPKIYGSLCQ